VAERKVLCDSVGVRSGNSSGPAQAAAASGAFARQQVAFARMRADNLARGRYLEPLGHRFLGLYTLWTSHNLTIKKSAKYKSRKRPVQAAF